jgi:DNA-3-methyladenine glycosylase II
VSRRPKSWRGIQIHTIGHSTRAFDELVAILREFGISVLADIRTIPRSRRNPQFGGDVLSAALGARGIRYVHVPELGGLRRASKSSPNAAWRNPSFRGYADHMQTEEFEAGLAKVRDLAAEGSVALMCAEAVPWRCHRSLVADALTARGARVEDITGLTRSTVHRMTGFASIDGTRVTYPGDNDGEGERLVTRGPFHLEATVRALQRRPNKSVDVWEQARYLRVLPSSSGLALVALANRGTIDEPDLRFTMLRGRGSSTSRTALGATLRRVLGLDVDPGPLQHLVTVNRRLRETMTALRGMRPPRFASLFEAFANVVPFQQLSLDAGVALVGRLVERFGEHVEHGGRRHHAFPTARAVADSRLTAIRACGLSARKADTIRWAARAIESGELTEDELLRMSSADAIRCLTDVPGIGPWSAGLILLRGLGRLDVFPPGDVGATRGLGDLLGVSAGPAFDRVVERFGDRRGYLYFCSLGASLLAKHLIHPASD